MELATQLPLLSPSEQSDLAEQEQVIEIGLATFTKVGNALLVIRDDPRKLYREYGTFEDYLQVRWELGKRHAYFLISATQVVNNIKGEQFVHLPTREAQARPLASLTPDAQRKVWEQAVANAPNGKPTASQVAKAAAPYKAPVTKRIDVDDFDGFYDDVPVRQIDEETGELLEARQDMPTTSPMGRHKPKTNRGADEYKPQGTDACQTPAYALDPLLPYLDTSWKLWEPACGEGLLVDAMYDSGFKSVHGSDLLTGKNFFEYEPLSEWDHLITNPPYTLKYKWLARCYELGKPFALLVPVDTIAAVSAQVLLKEYGFEMLLLDRRVNFKMPNKGYAGSGAQFPVMWLCWKVLPQQVMFGHIEYPKNERVEAIDE